MSSRVLRAVYRATLRNAAHFDRDPALKALLSRDPYDGPHGEGCTSFDAALQRFLGSSCFYVPALPQPRGAAAAVRDAFRHMGGDLDAGFEALRALQAALNHARRLELLPPRGGRRRRGAGGRRHSGAVAPPGSPWALLPPGRGLEPPRAGLQPLVAPRVGSLLLSHPRLGSPGDEFHHTAVLVCAHDDKEGTLGVVLDTPTREDLTSLLASARHGAGDAQRAGPEPPGWWPAFPQSPGHRGHLFFPSGKRLTPGALAAIRVMRPRIRFRRDGSLLVSFHVPSCTVAEAAAAASASAMELRHTQAMPDVLRRDDGDPGWLFDEDAGAGQGQGGHDHDDGDDLDQASFVRGQEPSRDRVLRVLRLGAQDDEPSRGGGLSSDDDDETSHSSEFSDSDSDSEDEEGDQLIDSRTLHQLLMDDVVASRAASRRLVVDTCGPDLLAACGPAKLQHGGPVTGVTVLHACAAAGGQEVLPGVFRGGDLASITSALRAGSLRQSGVRVFAGHAAWAPGQLDRELERGEWLVAQGSPVWVLGQQHRSRRVRSRAPGGGPVAGKGLARSSALWARALSAMGGEFAALAAL